MKPVRKVVFPVAGLGTRFLPATKAMPKEMLPVVDKPLIQYAVEEAAAAGVTDMIFITGRYKRAIEDHFDKSPELEEDLARKGKTELLDLVHSITPAGVNFIYIRQPEPLGLGHAVLCAQPVVGDEPFGVILADDLVYAQTPALKQLTDARERMGGGSRTCRMIRPTSTVLWAWKTRFAPPAACIRSWKSRSPRTPRRIWP